MWPSVQLPEKGRDSPETLAELRKVFKLKMDNFNLVAQFIEENGVDCDFQMNGAVRERESYIFIINVSLIISFFSSLLIRCASD